MLLGDVLKNIDQKYKSIKFKNIRFNSKDCKLNDIFFSVGISLFSSLIASYIPILRIFRIKPNLILR